MKLALKMLLISLALADAAKGQSDGIFGQWTEPTGSVIRVDHCGPQICMWVVGISPKAPANVDIYNPDDAKRKRSLCGLQIGTGFVMGSPNEARGGTLYDPKSGKTYRGQMKLKNNTLDLRGYVGISLFGQTQTWNRPTMPVKPCTPEIQKK